MTKKLLALLVVGMPAAAFSQVTTLGPFTGTFSDGFESYAYTFYNTLAVFGGNATMNATGNGQGMNVTSGWSFFYNIGPHSGNNFMGGAGSNYTITFNTPAAKFGAYFGTNADVADATATFFDINGNQIGSSLNITAPLGSWNWDGYQDASGIKSISIVANNSFGGFIDIDDMQYTPVSAPEPCSLIAMGLGVAALLRRRARS